MIIKMFTKIKRTMYELNENFKKEIKNTGKYQTKQRAE